MVDLTQSGLRALRLQSVVLVALTLAMSYLAVGSINPLAVYGSDSTWGKIVVTFLSVMFVGVVLAYVQISLLRLAISRTTQKRADDVSCLGCGHPLLQFIGSHGKPRLCLKCTKWWHNGPACFKRDLPRNASLMDPCPHCRANESREQQFFDQME